MTTRRPVFAVAALAALAAASAAPAVMAQDEEPLAVKAVYSSVIEEPWDGVIHAALEAEAAAGRITYTFQDDIGYAGDMELVAARDRRGRAARPSSSATPSATRRPSRRVAADYPDIPFVFGSGGGPAEPNFSVFDNWIHEPAYLAGMLAGGLTKSDVIGVVAGYPVPEVEPHHQRLHPGAQAQNPDVEVKVTLHQQLVRPGHGQGSRPRPDRGRR